MGIVRKMIVVGACLFASGVVIARPVSWSGGSTFMYKSNFMYTSYYYHFSPSYKYSVGFELVDDKHFRDEYLNLRSTYLLDRKNTKESQRNL